MYLNNKILITLLLGCGFFYSSVVFAQAAEPAAEPAAAAAATAEIAADGDEAAADVDPGMQIPVDGSSLEAFNKSLETIKAQSQEANYISLEEAIKYLLVYDLGAGRDRAKLAKNLDGLTGEQIIDKVQWRK